MYYNNKILEKWKFNLFQIKQIKNKLIKTNNNNKFKIKLMIINKKE